MRHLQHYIEEGLRIVDDEGVDYFSEEENCELHQRRQDENIDHDGEKNYCRWEKIERRLQELKDLVM